MIVALLRVVGQQALARMSSFDVVFTVTLGSVVGTVVISREIPIAEAVAALLTLLGMQELTRFFQSRSLRVHHAVRQPPRVMLWNGELLEDRQARGESDESAFFGLPIPGRPDDSPGGGSDSAEPVGPRRLP